MRPVFALVLTLALGALPGCRIVHESEMQTEVPDGPEGDDIRNTARIEETFDARLMPLIRDEALTVAELRAEIGGGFDTAGEAHGNRGAGIGAAWNFAVRGEGPIMEANLDTSARTVLVDTDDDGAGDVTVQLGPVIRGTALRDVAPFYNFDDFRDQIEFAKLARAVNDRVKPGLVVPEGALVGTRLSFIGVTPLKAADEAMVVTPVTLEFAP